MTILRLGADEIDADEMLAELDRAECEESLYAFLMSGWQYTHPAPFSPACSIEAVSAHLHAISSRATR